MVTVDFNPAADRLRLMSNDGTSLRVNVDDGKVTKDGTTSSPTTDMHKGEKPNVVAGAYTNSVKGTKETALYNIDGTIGALVKQAPPNDGMLNAIGKLGIKADSVAFDIWSDGKGKNDAWLMAGDTLYSVDLASGKATAGRQDLGRQGPGARHRDPAGDVTPAMRHDLGPHSRDRRAPDPRPARVGFFTPPGRRRSPRRPETARAIPAASLETSDRWRSPGGSSPCSRAVRSRPPG